MFADARDRKQICPHTVEKFDLRQRRGGRVLRLTPGAGGAGDVRPSPVVSVKATLRPGAKLGAHVDRQHAEEDGCNLSSMGDAIGRAMRAPTKYGRSVWRAESWPRVARRGRGPGQPLLPLRGNSPSRALRNCTAIHLLASYGVAVVPLTLTQQMGGSRKASLTLARAARPEGKGLIRKKGRSFYPRAARPEGGGGDSQEAGGTLVPPPLVRLSRAATPFPPPAGGEILCP